MNVETLRRNGYKVRVRHERQFMNGVRLTRREWEKSYKVSEVKYSELVSSFGGCTQVEITTPKGEEFLGVAKCSDLDQFNRKLGLTIAIGRALKGVSVAQ